MHYKILCLRSKSARVSTIYAFFFMIAFSSWAVNVHTPPHTKARTNPLTRPRSLYTQSPSKGCGTFRVRENRCILLASPRHAPARHWDDGAAIGPPCTTQIALDAASTVWTYGYTSTRAESLFQCTHIDSIFNVGRAVPMTPLRG